MADQMNVFPLKDAYPFGISHGCDAEISAIRDMVIEWDLSYSSSLRRGLLIDLFMKKGVYEAFKQQHWPAGNTPWGQRKAEFWLRLKDRYENFLAGRDSGSEADDEEDAESETFALEIHLRDYLAKNLGRVEPGLRLYEADGRKGIEFPVDDGRIDILAVDSSGQFVVFELKVGRGRNKVIGQLLYYMAWVDKHLANRPCRGIIVAKEISEDLSLAVARAKGVSLFKYKLSVSVEPVTQ